MVDILGWTMETLPGPAATPAGLQRGAAALRLAPERCDEHNLKSISGNSYCISILFAEMGCRERRRGGETSIALTKPSTAAHKGRSNNHQRTNPRGK